MPAALNLPFGKLFFGYEVIPLGGKEAAGGDPKAAAVSFSLSLPIHLQFKLTGNGKQESFSGSGNTLSGRTPRASTNGGVAASSSSPGQTLEGSGSGGGQRLGGNKPSNGRDDDVIEIDSDSDEL